MDNQLTLISDLRLLDGQIGERKLFLAGLIPQINAEPVVIEYCLHQGATNTAEFTFPNERKVRSGSNNLDKTSTTMLSIYDCIAGVTELDCGKRPRLNLRY